MFLSYQEGSQDPLVWGNGHYMAGSLSSSLGSELLDLFIIKYLLDVPSTKLDFLEKFFHG